MQEIRFSLEKYKGRSSRYYCPQCQQRTFTKYIDHHSCNYLSDITGRCNRVEKCGYHFTPKMYFEQYGKITDDNYNVPLIKPKQQQLNLKPSHIDKAVLFQSLKNYEENNFAIGLAQYFSYDQVIEVLQRYYVGTAKGNKTIYWQVNRLGEVRTGKIMQYNKVTLKRQGYINWVHHVLNLKDFNLKQVFFGSHLLIDKITPVAIAEGEKNAIFGALYYPQYNWIAVGSIEMLNVQKLNTLKDYQVTLFPDKGKAFVKWSEIVHNACFDVKVDDVLEKTDLKEGEDIADLVISVQRVAKNSSPEVIVNKLISKNPSLKSLIDVFDLKVTYCAE